MRWLDHGWRLSVTAAAFAFIFFGGGVLAVTLLPVLALVPGHRRDRPQWVIHRSFRLYIELLQRCGLIRLETEGLEKLDRAEGRLVVANHPSLLDVVLLMALLPRVQCIVKHELWAHPFLGPLMRRAGYIRNDVAPEALMQACIDTLKAGNNLIVFPEGTRTVRGRAMKLHRGFANIAILAEADLRLIDITCEPPLLHKGNPWWKVPATRTEFLMEVGERLDIRQFLGYRYRSLSARKLVGVIEAHYAEKFGHGRVGTGSEAVDRLGAEARGFGA